MSSSRSLMAKAFSGLGQVINFLPTGTVFAFRFLIPIVTNSGHCHLINKYITGALIIICALCCAITSFTDSYIGSDGQRHYGIVTANGIWPSPTSSDHMDLSKYKLRVGDFVHSLASVVVFAVISLLDTNTVRCFYPKFELSQKVLLQVLPPVIGVVSSAVLVVFPNNRHGIGYPTSFVANGTTATATTTTTIATATSAKKKSKA